MPEFRFFVAGEVVSKPAKRVTALMRNGHPVTNLKTGRPIVMAHDAKDASGQRAAQWTARLRHEAEENMHEDWPIKKPHPVFVRLALFKQKPASWSKNRHWFTVKPDRDNCEKLFNDALKKVVFEDDTQVVGGDVVKVVAPFDGMMVQIQWGPQVERSFDEYFYNLTDIAAQLRGGAQFSRAVQVPMSLNQASLFAEVGT